MDKYTVDLDQVLNDFEYSELTDQYSNSASYLNNVHASSSQLQQTRNAPTKHSINNVFQSLNDYLNSDIGVRSQANLDSSLQETQSSLFITEASPSVELHKEVDLCVNVEEEDPSSCIILNQGVNSTVALVQDTKTELDESNLELETSLEEKRVESPFESQDLVENLHRAPNTSENLDEINISSFLLTQLEVKNAISVENVNLNSVLPQVDEIEQTDSSEDESLSSVQETLEKSKEEDSCLTVNVDIKSPSPEKVVSFDQKVDLDESELRSYLEELECESASLSVEEKTETSRPNTLEINSPTEIDLVGEPGSTPYNNVYVANNLPKVEVSTTESDTESSRSMSPTFSDSSTELNESTASAESVVVDVPVSKAKVTSSPIEQVHEEACGGALEDSPNEEPIEKEIVEPKEDALSLSDYGASRIDMEMFKEAPMWIPDSDALSCMHCDLKFTMIKRRHHCRACGLVLCSKCCGMKYKLQFLDAEARVCVKCFEILTKDIPGDGNNEISGLLHSSPHRPNPNNPMEYCSTIPPMQQVGTSQNVPPPSVIVPVGVLKRQGSAKTRSTKSVMFCDGIRPGSELTDLDNDFNYEAKHNKKGTSPPPVKTKRNEPLMDAITKSYIPNGCTTLPPTVTTFKSDIKFSECTNDSALVEQLKKEVVTFALHSNLHVHVKIINMDCCINKLAWCFSSEGMITVGQDEILYIMELIENEVTLPKEIFLHLASIYNDAKKGTSITENGISIYNTSNFLDSKNHIGFLYIRPSFQCLQNVIVPKEPYLIGILIHRWEMPWAKIFPLRLILRLGAEYRYYPSPIISTRHRESVFVEIGHTIINLLADFRNFSYTLPNIRGLTIHMEDKNTTVEIPLNRYEQVLKSMSNSSDHILAFGGNFSTKADSHLVCIQDTQGNNENTYTTHAINIHNKPRKVTGASFIVFNGALKSTSGLTAKSSIIEDGLMIQIPPEHMLQIRESLRKMKNHTISCGCINSTSDETVNIVWIENDVNFNVGVLSSVDNKPLTGVPSIRVHNGKDYVCTNGSRMIRWTEVFILQNGDKRGQEIDFSKLAENISKATCQGLVKYIDLLASNNYYKIGIRTTLHVENVSYSAGSNGTKLPPIYMRSLDNELIPVLHRITTNNLGENTVVLELVFRILNA